MKVKVRYHQKIDTLGYYNFYRIIELEPFNKLFKNKIKTLIASSCRITKIEYCKDVRKILGYTKEELINIIRPKIAEHLSDPSKLWEEIKNFEIELEID